MSDTTRDVLLRFFVARYDELRTRLTQRLGSSEIASEAMQDAWLKLARAKTVGPIQSPGRYIFQVALNAAWDSLHRGHHKYITTVDMEELLEVADRSPDPARTVETRSDLRLLEVAVMELSPRRREVLLAARLDGLSHPEIARRLGVSVRLVEKELHLALAHCLARLNT